MSRNRYLPWLDVGRAGAAVLVMLTHLSAIARYQFDITGPAFIDWFAFGRAGVDFFFVLSGFIITYIHLADLGRPDRLSRYGGRRLARIYPAYWAATLLMILLMMATGDPWLADATGLDMAFTALLIPTVGVDTFALTVAWSLSHEMLFYGLFGIAILIKGSARVILGAWVLVTLIGLAVPDLDIPASRFHLHFFIGIAIGWLIRQDRDAPAPLAFLLIGCAAFALIAGLQMTIWTYQSGVDHAVAYALASGAIIYGIVSLQSAPKPPAWLLLMGQASYSIYLVHIPFLLISSEILVRTTLADRMGAGTATGVTFVAALILCLIFYRLVEKPLLDKSRAFLALRS